MRVCFYGTPSQYGTFRSLLDQLPHLKDRFHSFHLHPDYDGLVDALRAQAFDLVFVSHDNACGMEGVIAVRNIQPSTPVIWFSNDEDFGSQAYRLHTDFFHSKPISPVILEMAMHRALPQLFSD